MDPAYEAHCVNLSLINFWKLFLKNINESGKNKYEKIYTNKKNPR